MNIGQSMTVKVIVLLGSLRRVNSLVVRIGAFQALDPGSNPG